GRLGQSGPETAAAVEELRGLVALHPVFEDVYMRRVLVHLTHRHLVRAPVALGPPAVDFFWAGPAFGSAQYNHRPERPLRETVHTRIGLDTLDFASDGVECGGHQFVHSFRLISLDKVGRVAITAEKMVKLLVTDPGENARIG